MVPLGQRVFRGAHQLVLLSRSKRTIDKMHGILEASVTNEWRPGDIMFCGCGRNLVFWTESWSESGSCLAISCIR